MADGAGGGGGIMGNFRAFEKRSRNLNRREEKQNVEVGVSDPKGEMDAATQTLGKSPETCFHSASQIQVPAIHSVFR